MGQMVNMSFFGETSGCDMPVEEDKCATSEKKAKETNCCFDVVDVVKSTNSELKQENPFTTFTIKFATAYFYTLTNFFEVLREKVIPFKGYSPPLITYDIQVLHESFLI